MVNISPPGTLASHEEQLLNKISDPSLKKWDKKWKAESGFSGASVFIAWVTYDNELSAYQVFKFGKKEQVEREHTKWEKYVKNGLTRFHGIPVKHFICEGDRAMIVYDCASADARFRSFKELFRNTAQPNDPKVCIEHLFKNVLSPWYVNVSFNQENLAGTVRNKLSDNKIQKYDRCIREITERTGNNLLQQAQGTGLSDLRDDLCGHFANHTTLTPRCIVHDDLNSENILLFRQKSLTVQDNGLYGDTDTDHICIIDYANTGTTNAFTDMTTLEAVIKFQLVNLENDDTWAQVPNFEDYCLGKFNLTVPNNQQPFARNTELVKAALAISALREQARSILDRNNLCPETSYWVYLFLSTVRHLGYTDLSPRQKLYALLSAAKIKDKIKLIRNP